MPQETMRYLHCMSLFLLFGQSQPVYSAMTGFQTISAASFETTDPRTGTKLTILVSEFLISRTEVTQEEFSEVMNYNPSFYGGADRPVENVSWWEAIRYCNLRSAKDGLQACYNLSTGECDFFRNGYRLPTDTEWDLAKGKPSYKDSETFRKYAYVGSTNTQNRDVLTKGVRAGTRTVGSYLPNELGIYDMFGNVWEWCHDFYDRAGTPTTLRTLLVTFAA